MRYFDIFRHADDDESENKLITELGQEQIRRLVEGIRRVGIYYHSFITSPYPQCRETVKLVMKLLGYNETCLSGGLKLCTPKPNEWNQAFYSEEFQRILPQIGSKYATAIILIPWLLSFDANHFIQQLEKYSKEIPDEVKVLGVSHNTMILAAASLINAGKLKDERFLFLDNCEGIRFCIKEGKIISCCRINF